MGMIQMLIKSGCRLLIFKDTHTDSFCVCISRGEAHIFKLLAASPGIGQQNY